MLTDDQTTELQFAIDADDAELVRRLLAPHTAQVLSELQFYGNSTAFMYACERSTPEVVRAFLDQGITPFELPFSDNNELKAAVRNRKFPEAMVTLVLEMLPDDLTYDMITSDWDPDELGEGKLLSAFSLASKLSDPRCKELMLEALQRLKSS